jgi:acyl-CoA synthetase (AMP-forming)/AMP-acid ligase II
MALALPIIRDDEISRDPANLAARWESRETFVILPEKLAVESAWLETLLDAVPAHLREEHYGLLTSGSTGEPKLIVGRRSRTEALTRVLHAAQENEPVRSTVVALPLSYSYAFVNQWLWSRVHNRGLVLTDGLGDPAALRARLEDTEESMLCLVGAQVPLLLRHFENSSFGNVIRLNFAGGRFPQEHLPALARLFPAAEIRNNYGCAEALPRLTVRRSDNGAAALNIGRPIDGVELRVGEADALEFRSPYRAVAIGSRGQVEAIADDAWLPTGDLGRQTADGSWELVGRASEVFKRFGEKISPIQLLESIGRVWDGSAAFYLTTDTLGETAHVLVLAPTPDAAAVNRVLQQLRRQFARPHWPYRVEALDALPLLASGKTDTLALGKLGGTVMWSQRY